MISLDKELIDRATEVVGERLARTPLIPSRPLSERTGREVFLKCETHQPTGSFKVRGALACLAALDRQTSQRGVVAASAGNHGLGVAWASRQLGIPALVVLPTNAPQVKLAKLREMMVKVRQAGASYDEAEIQALEIAAEAGATFVSPFDDAWIMAGNGGSMGREIIEQLPDVSTVIVPVGGGGCAAGLGAVLTQRGVAVIGVNSEASPAMARSLADGVVYHRWTPTETIAEGLEGGVSDSSVALCRELLASVQVTSEASLAEAIRFVVRHHSIVIEGSAAAGVAALLDGPGGPATGDGPVCVVLTGRNIDQPRLRGILQEDRTSR